MSDRFVSSVATAAELLALMQRYPGDTFGGGPGSLSDAAAAAWGPADPTAQHESGRRVGSPYTVAYRRAYGAGGAAYLALIDGPPASGSSWEAWRVDLEFGADGSDPPSPEKRAADQARTDRTFGWALAGIVGVVALLALSSKG